jgi:hypothetical protein
MIQLALLYIQLLISPSLYKPQTHYPRKLHSTWSWDNNFSLSKFDGEIHKQIQVEHYIWEYVLQVILGKKLRVYKCSFPITRANHASYITSTNNNTFVLLITLPTQKRFLSNHTVDSTGLLAENSAESVRTCRVTAAAAVGRPVEGKLERAAALIHQSAISSCSRSAMRL